MYKYINHKKDFPFHYRFHTSDSHSWLLCSVASFYSSSLEPLVPVLSKIRHHAGYQITHCESKIIKCFTTKLLTREFRAINVQKERQSRIRTNRKEEEGNDKYPEASLASIKVIKSCSISAGMQHWCLQLCGLRTGITCEQEKQTLLYFKHLVFN